MRERKNNGSTWERKKSFVCGDEKSENWREKERV